MNITWVGNKSAVLRSGNETSLTHPAKSYMYTITKLNKCMAPP